MIKDMIKVHFTIQPEEGVRLPAGETVWAEKISENLAKINNIPFFVDEVSLHDLVSIKEVDGIYEYINTIQKNTNKFFLSYPKGETKEETKETFKEIHNYLTEKQGKVESYMEGICSVAFDIGISKLEVDQILNDCPHLLDIEEE